VTGLALSIGTMVSGALVAEVVFSYPGLGNTILKGVMGQDYPLISGVTLIITMMVLVAFFVIELVYGLIDPRIKATQSN
jgi:ABC-type dipeptide/oligopeptide/nickel transport systems, permease components